MDKTSGVIDAVRGVVSGQRQSGEAFGSSVKTAIDYISHYDRGYITAYKKLGKSLVNIIKRNSDTKDISYTKGKNKVENNIDFKNVENFDLTFEIIPLSSRTSDGRNKYLQTLMNFKAEISPEQIAHIMKTGSLESLSEKQTKLQSALEKEVSSIITGSVPLVSKFENHLVHIGNLYEAYSKSEVKKDDRATALIDEQIKIRKEYWKNLTQSECKMLGMPLFVEFEPPIPTEFPQPQLGGVEQQPQVPPQGNQIPPNLPQSNIPPQGGGVGEIQ